MYVFFCNAKVKLVQALRSLQNNLLICLHSNEFPNPKGTIYLRKLWNPNFKKKFGSAQENLFTNCSHFSTTFPDDLNYRKAENCRALKPVVKSKFKHCYHKFSDVYALRQHKNTQHSFPIKTARVQLEDILTENDDSNLEEELRSRQHILVFSEIKPIKHKIFNYALKKQDATIVDEKLDPFFNSKSLILDVLSINRKSQAVRGKNISIPVDICLTYLVGKILQFFR